MACAFWRKRRVKRREMPFKFARERLELAASLYLVFQCALDSHPLLLGAERNLLGADVRIFDIAQFHLNRVKKRGQEHLRIMCKHQY